MQKIKVLVNKAARSGSDRQRLDVIRQELAGFDLEIIVPDSYEALCQAARVARTDGTHVVVVVGGDGTINAVANQLAMSDVPLGIIPAGTANDLAKNLGIPRDPAQACQLIKRRLLKKQVLEIDLAEINGRYFITGGGMGMVSRVAVGINRMKSKDGWLRNGIRFIGGLSYVLYAFYLLLLSRRLSGQLQITADGKDLGRQSSVALFVSNQPVIGKTVQSCPDTREDDGQLGLCLMKGRSRMGSILTTVLMSLQGRHTHRRDIEIMEIKSLEIKAPIAKTFIGDGEVLAHTRNLSLSVLPKGLKVLARGNHPRLKSA